MTPVSRALDQYFTPSKLAADLLAAVTIDNPESVADFAAGDGELLRAAVDRWPSVNCIATDVDDQVVDLLGRTHPEWSSSCCDFLSFESRDSNSDLLKNKELLQLITLNPPFSIKGKEFHKIEIAGNKAKCSPALAFVIEATKYLTKDGQLVAILPFGLVHSEKNDYALRLLKKYNGFEIVKTYEKGGFTNCNPKTAIVRLTAKIESSLSSDNIDNNKIDKLKLSTIAEAIVSIHRGGVPNNNDFEGRLKKYPFIHTTNLKNNKIIDINRHTDDMHKKFCGPGIILPRVGRPSIEKVVLIENSDVFVLSECLFMVECKTLHDAKTMYLHILNNWNTFINSYSGTCASYISLKGFSRYLSNSNFIVLPSGMSIRNNQQNEAKVKSNIVIKNAAKNLELATA
jgi:predicted RNA methylase